MKFVFAVLLIMFAIPQSAPEKKPDDLTIFNGDTTSSALVLVPNMKMEPILICSGTNPVSGCKIQKGHTLDEVMQAEAIALNESFHARDELGKSYERTLRRYINLMGRCGEHRL